MVNLEKLTEAWLANQEFPKEVGSLPFGPRRFIALDQTEYLNFILENVENQNLYSSINSVNEIKNGKRDYLLLDFDSAEKLLKAYEDCNKVQNYLESHFGCLISRKFSGYKGFHLKIKLNSIAVPFEAIKVYFMTLAKNLKVTTLDFKVFDYRRLERVVYSKHLDSNRLCIPVERNWNLHKVLEESKEVTEITVPSLKPSHEFSKELLNYYKSHQKLDYISFKIPSETDIDSIERLLNLNIKDGRHRLLYYIIIPRLLRADYMKEEVLEFCKKFIERTGKPWKEYSYYAERCFSKLPKKKYPLMSFDRFLLEHQDLLKFFRSDIKC